MKIVNNLNALTRRFVLFREKTFGLRAENKNATTSVVAAAFPTTSTQMVP